MYKDGKGSYMNIVLQERLVVQASQATMLYKSAHSTVPVNLSSCLANTGVDG